MEQLFHFSNISTASGGCSPLRFHSDRDCLTLSLSQQTKGTLNHWGYAFMGLLLVDGWRQGEQSLWLAPQVGCHLPQVEFCRYTIPESLYEVEYLGMLQRFAIAVNEPDSHRSFVLLQQCFGLLSSEYRLAFEDQSLYTAFSDYVDYCRNDPKSATPHRFDTAPTPPEKQQVVDVLCQFCTEKTAISR